MRMQSNDSDENLLSEFESIPRVNSQSTSVTSDTSNDYFYSLCVFLTYEYHYDFFATEWSKGPPSPDEFGSNDFVMAGMIYSNLNFCNRRELKTSLM